MVAMERAVPAKRLLIVPSRSRYEIEIGKHGSEEAARAWFGKTEVWEYIASSHAAQKQNLTLLQQSLSHHSIDRSQLDEEIISKHDLFAFVGGDNHFTYCSQVILQYQRAHPREQKDVIGVLLDPTKSLGALLQCTMPEFIRQASELQRGGYTAESWTTLEARISDGNGQPFPAVGEYFIGERDREEMSRNRAYVDGRPVLSEKGSGILIVTGAGAGDGSWYDNVHYLAFRGPDALGREERAAHAIVTETKQSFLKGGESAKVRLLPGQTFAVYSYNDDNGMFLPDAHRDHGARFKIGSRADIKVSDNYLRVVRKN
jgi:hypothetical protein